GLTARSHCCTITGSARPGGDTSGTSIASIAASTRAGCSHTTVGPAASAGAGAVIAPAGACSVPICVVPYIIRTLPAVTLAVSRYARSGTYRDVGRANGDTRPGCLVSLQGKRGAVGNSDVAVC